MQCLRGSTGSSEAVPDMNQSTGKERENAAEGRFNLLEGDIVLG